MVSTLEVARKTSGSLDCEFRAHGIASLVAAPFGGLMCSLQTGTSRLLEQAGGATRMSGIACALTLGAVGIAQLNLPALIPIPIVAGLVFYLGLHVPRRRAVAPLSATLLARSAVSGRHHGGMHRLRLFGRGAGWIAGRLRFVRDQLCAPGRCPAPRYASTVCKLRVAFDGASEYLRRTGEAIQLYWLSGYIFFGSSEGMLERIRNHIEALPPRQVSYVILDFAAVPGADSSAVQSLAKLHNFCDRQGIALVYAALAKPIRTALGVNGLFKGDGRHRTFDDINLALAWCEDRLIAEAKLDSAPGLDGFEGGCNASSVQTLPRPTSSHT
jgi:SulP family sulfate permease